MYAVPQQKAATQIRPECEPYRPTAAVAYHPSREQNCHLIFQFEDDMNPDRIRLSVEVIGITALVLSLVFVTFQT